MLSVSAHMCAVFAKPIRQVVRLHACSHAADAVLDRMQQQRWGGQCLAEENISLFVHAQYGHT
jgi:hypothetical protein